MAGRGSPCPLASDRALDDPQAGCQGRHQPPRIAPRPGVPAHTSSSGWSTTLAYWIPIWPPWNGRFSWSRLSPDSSARLGRPMESRDHRGGRVGGGTSAVGDGCRWVIGVHHGLVRSTVLGVPRRDAVLGDRVDRSPRRAADTTAHVAREVGVGIVVDHPRRSSRWRRRSPPRVSLLLGERRLPGLRGHPVSAFRTRRDVVQRGVVGLIDRFDHFGGVHRRDHLSAVGPAGGTAPFRKRRSRIASMISNPERAQADADQAITSLLGDHPRSPGRAEADHPPARGDDQHRARASAGSSECRRRHHQVPSRQRYWVRRIGRRHRCRPERPSGADQLFELGLEVGSSAGCGTAPRMCAAARRRPSSVRCWLMVPMTRCLCSASACRTSAFRSCRSWA